MPNRNGQASIGITVFLFSLGIVLLFGILHLPIQFSFVFILGCIVFVIAFVNTDVALIILILSMLLSPEIKVGGIPGRAVVIRSDDLLLLVVFFGWLAKVAINKQLGFLRSTALNRPILVYVFICIFATLLGILQGYLDVKQAVFYLLKYIEYFLLFFMVANNLKTVRQAKVFVFFILLTCFLVCLYAWGQIPSGVRLSAPFEGEGGEPNTFAGYLLLMMAIILGFILRTESKKHRLLLLGLLGFISTPFVLTLSRGGWLAFFPMLLTLIVINRKLRHYLLIVFIAMIILLPYAAPQKVRRRIEEAFVPERTYTLFGKRLTFSESASARIESWRGGFEKWSKRPIFGYGIPSAAVIDNQFTRVLTETGLLGFMAFVWVILRLFRCAWQVYKYKQNSGFSEGLSLGFIAGLVGLLTQSLTAANFIIVRIMEPFWFLAAIMVMLPELQPVTEE